MKSQSTIAYEQIKDMIFHMELLPGTKISEPQISAKLSISRTPIHDALRKIAAEGLVKIGTNRGATVSKFTEEEIQEIGTIRLSQDILAARLAAYYGSVADFERLHYLADVCEEAATKGDVYGRIKADNDFHLEISKISGNKHLYEQQYAIYQQVHLIHILQYTDIEASIMQICHHKPLIEAIRGARFEDMSFLLCEHLKDFYHISPYVMNCYGYDESKAEGKMS